ncbi:hypothetical protein NQ317_014121 [Molorchus minor]|uniref:Transposable element P transposase-like RNase H C-terminal domain-containing protein n=1 Tax=Molorchus minor TaxID=1323400 RepID=A0ABQ9JMD3_9CUCU|nr:hypothetical protein NQ317_014121 [Molorchus minor]
MKVKVAAQQLSQTMAAAIETFHATGGVSLGKNCVLPKIEKWKLIDSKTGRVRSNYKFVQGWMNSIRAIMLLWRNLKAKGLKFLSLRNLNQDPLENLFGQIRQHGICNTNPTCYQFVAALKTVVINNFGAPISRGNNCEEDYCKSLGDFSTFLQNYSLAENAEGSAKDNDINLDIDLDKESNFDDYNQATAFSQVTFSKR